jgi:hypothetical protein
LCRRLSSVRRVRPARLGSCVSWLAAALRQCRHGSVLMAAKLLMRLLWISSSSSFVSPCSVRPRTCSSTMHIGVSIHRSRQKGCTNELHQACTCQTLDIKSSHPKLKCTTTG